MLHQNKSLILDQKNIKKIAILRALFLGDLLCTVPAFRAIRKFYPKAEISLIGLPWSKSYVQRFNKYIDKYIEFPGYPPFPEINFNIKRFPEFLNRMIDERFDLVLQMQGDGTYANLLVSLFGAKKLSGFYLPDKSFKPNDEYFVKYPDNLPEIRRHIYFLQKLGIKTDGEKLEFPISINERIEYQKLANKLMLRNQSYVVFHPGARNPKRRWSLQKFIKVANQVSTLGYKIVLTGSENEKNITAKFKAQLSHSVINLAGETELGVTAQVIKDAKLVITNDTGISHIAAAMKTPSIIIFYPSISDPNRWAPLNKELHTVVNAEESGDMDKVLKGFKTAIKESNDLLNKTRINKRKEISAITAV